MRHPPRRNECAIAAGLAQETARPKHPVPVALAQAMPGVDGLNALPRLAPHWLKTSKLRISLVMLRYEAWLGFYLAAKLTFRCAASCVMQWCTLHDYARHYAAIAIEARAAWDRRQFAEAYAALRRIGRTQAHKI
eukprot:9473546-Pyramimonas_sp.AAC.1